ncbi:RNA polymerase sigma factor SigJ [Turneriella parva]|uniref:RNA polymerase, sigma-24 subunit, ECF subfamily n=1 Tax=Turneriella parva (strain ATCC BAA-1111 / DSM 21527 / NCTC 11395 / H) TaxID=869212 RepID=I4B1N9_TURPD|nr:RNA polymerase sigma factor SigJ [Turneriella parva]AFM11196.1 RNA polymerase, sigma-24 subunit, ECF subfamily [Turneriella parva DSM 21527]
MSASHLTLYTETRPRLLSLAYRMTGSLADSEDILQEAWLRFAQVPAEKVGSAAALLTTIVTRLCLDLLRSARKKRETYVGPWLPEPMPDLYLAHEDAMQRETVSYAFLLLLQKLAPAERAVFILREIFDYDYIEIAKVVRKSADNCRQVFHRAKKSLRRELGVQTSAGPHERELLAAFLAACSGDNLEKLVQMLGHDATLLSDGGGKVNASSIPVVGKSKVAKFIFAVRHKGGRKLYYAARMNNTDAIIIYADGKPYAAQFFEYGHGRITRTLIVRNPNKLTLFADREKLLSQGILQPVAKFLGAKATLLIAANSLMRFLFSRRAPSALR